MFVCCDYCVLSGRGLCDELITRPEEFYRLWCFVVFVLENFKNEEAMTRVGSQRHSKKKIVFLRISTSLHTDITRLIVNQVLFYYPINKTVPILCIWFSFDTTICFGCPHLS